MSTDRKRLTSAIQRIAREDPDIRALLGGYRNAGGFPSEAATSESGGEDRRICCDGSSSDNTNPGSESRDPSDGGQDAGDGLDPEDPANLNEVGPGSLDGLTDCATGEPVCFEGSDWIPPEGWESPSEGPIDPMYRPGCYYSYEKGGEVNYTSHPGVFCSALAEDGWSVSGYTILPSSSNDCDNLFCAYDDPDSTSTPTKTTFGISCENEFTSACEEPPPTLDEWPSDDCVNLAIRGGKIVGSKRDPENDGSYSKPRNSIELCDDYGNSFTLAPSASGGWKSISAQNPGDGYLYNSRGEQIARISGSEFSDPKV